MGLFAGLPQRFRKVLPAVALALLAPPASALTDGVTTSYGYAVFGELKYGPGFTHFDYVNPDAPKGGSYRSAELSTFDSLNQVPLVGIFPTSVMLLSDTLLRQSRDETASYYCLICKTVSWPADKSWAEFELDPRARFQDGQPITVDDVIFSVSLGKGLSLPAFVRPAQTIARIERTGPGKVRFHFTMKDNPTLLTVVGLMPVLPKHWYARRDPFKPSLDVPVLAGPYKIARVNPGRSISYRRDPDYWAKDHPLNRGRFNFDTVRIDYYRDQQMMNEAFRVGLVDLRLDRSAVDLRAERNLPAVRAGNIKRIRIPYRNAAFYNAITLNARRPFLSDERVRKALTLAYDYEWVKQVILAGDYGRTVSNFANSDFEASGLPTTDELKVLDRHRDSLPPELFRRPPWVPTGGSREKMRANLVEARRLLRQAGYRVAGGRLIDSATGLPVTLRLVAYSPLLLNQVSLFIRNARKLGIEISFRAVDAAQMRHLQRSYNYDLLYYRTVFAPLPTPSAGMAQIWTSQSAITPGQLNYPGASDPALDDAIATMIAATDRATVVGAMRAVDRVARWRFYSIPLAHSYPAPVGTLPISYWDKFGRSGKEPTWNFPYWDADTWWYDPARAARLSHGVYR